MKKMFYILVLTTANLSFAQTSVLTENFDTEIPATFTLYNQDGYVPNSAVSEYTSAWITVQDPQDANNTVASSTSYFEQPGMADRWLVTPQLSLGAYGNFLSWIGKSGDASYAESYLVLASTTDNAIASFTDTLVSVVNEDVYWTNHSLNLSELGYDNQNIHIAFVLRTVDGFKFFMDSLNVVKDDPVSVEMNEIESFSIYPNPADNFLKVKSDKQIEKVVIRTIQGEIVLETKSNNLKIDFLPSGVYIVEVYSDKNFFTSKLVKRYILNN